MSTTDNSEWSLAANASGEWILTYTGWYPGVVVMVPESVHAHHEHKLGYQTAWTIKAPDKTQYAIRVTNLESETAHFRFRWAPDL